MQLMNDILPVQPRDPRPDPAPRPRGARLWGGAARRRAAAISLAALLAVAALAATVGTVVASLRGVGSFGLGFPLASLTATMSEAYGRIWGATSSTFQLLATGREILALLPDLARGERGPEFIALLERAESQMAALGSSRILPSFDAKASDLARGVGSLRSWLAGAPERRIAVIFGNSAEMRAGGGFIGSFAEVTVRDGAVTGYEVRDINDADFESGDRTVPPTQLEPVATRWRAADANWFLSGPASGAAFLDLLNRSPLYATQPVDAAIFVSPRLVSDLLAVTGPVKAGTLAIDASSFLRSIQEEVQEGQATGAEKPKAVLDTLVPAFSEQLLSSARTSPLAVLDAVQGAFLRRDIVMYAEDDGLQRVIESLGVAGSLYPTADDFQGGYVAVAPSTIGGDKTDLVTGQALRVSEQLLPQGLVETLVEVERTHRGTETDPWWYQEEHRSYVKVYAPPGATLTGADGVWLRERPAATYDPSFLRYPALEAIEATVRRTDGIPGVTTFLETGKSVFGFWQRTARGQGTVASVTYARQLKRPFVAGDTYALVLERQPASTSSYRVELFAPPGLVWDATGTTRFLFESEDPDGRTVLPLLLRAAS